jgi:hypothetical protein
MMRDLTLTGLCHIVNEGDTKKVSELADRNAAEIEMHFEILYSTVDNDLTRSN